VTQDLSALSVRELQKFIANARSEALVVFTEPMLYAERQRPLADRTRRTPGRTPAFVFGASASPMSRRSGSGARTNASG
jgi:hypothetical protein